MAVILAAGRGTRLRLPSSKASSGSPLSEAQERAAASGIKALMPIRQASSDGETTHATPFLEFSLAALAHAGIEQVCCVIRPDLDDPYTFFPSHPEIDLSFSVQKQPCGTADAVLCAREAVADSDFLVLNSDTYYPSSLLLGLAQSPGPSVVALDGHALAKEPMSNLRAAQMAAWASITLDPNGDLDQVLVPPSKFPPAPWWVSINAWRLDARIFPACEALAKQTANKNAELEIPKAVQWSRSALGLRYRVVRSRACVLDLTSRDDIPDLEKLLPKMGAAHTTSNTPRRNPVD